MPLGGRCLGLELAPQGEPGAAFIDVVDFHLMCCILAGLSCCLSPAPAGSTWHEAAVAVEPPLRERRLQDAPVLDDVFDLLLLERAMGRAGSGNGSRRPRRRGCSRLRLSSTTTGSV